MMINGIGGHFYFRTILLVRKKEEEPYLFLYSALPLPRLYPCTLPTAPVSRISASDLPTKSISLIPTKDPGTNLFDC